MAKQIGRSELYARVWAEPMTKVAANLGISDVGLKKACIRHHIPTPKRGYWAKKAAGHTPSQTALPALKETASSLEKVTFGAPSDRAKSEGLREFRGDQRRRRNAAPIGTLKAPPFPKVERVGLILRPTVKKLRHGKLNDGAVSANEVGECGVVVSKATTERAIALLDALFRELRAKRWGIEAAGEATRVTSELGSMKFQLKEISRVINHIPTPAELEMDRKRRADRSSYSFGHFLSQPSWPAKDRVWTGLLKIEIIGSYLDIRRSWSDAQTQTLEGLLPRIVEGFSAFLYYQNQKAIEDAQKEERRAKLMARRQLASARHERESKRSGLLDEITETAMRLQRLDVWLSQAQPLPNQPEFVRMLTWARHQRAELQSRLNGDRLNDQLRKRELFPDPVSDPLCDPEGEPPEDPPYSWGYRG